VVAFVVPLFLLRRRVGAFDLADGAVVAILGTVILVSCVRDFSVSGNETLAPWALS